jgi:hypothetical protein
LDRVRKLQTILPSLLDIFYHPIFDFFKKNRVFQQPQGIITINCILNWWWERFIRLVQAETTFKKPTIQLGRHRGVPDHAAVGCGSRCGT